MTVNPGLQAVIDEFERRRPWIDDLMRAYHERRQARSVWRRFRDGWRAFLHEVVG